MMNHFFSGEWSLSDTNRQAAITSTPLDKSRFFRISCTDISTRPYQTIRCFVNNKPYTIPLCKESSFIIQGKSVFLEQDESTSGTIRGFWEVIQEPQIEFEEALWAVHPETEMHNILATSEEDIEFVLHFFKNQECINGCMNIIIDDRQVKDLKGKLITYLPGNSIIGKGKTISVAVSGSCSSEGSFKGSLTIRKIV